VKINDPSSCRHDLVSLGEVMLRLDPREGRVATTRSFQVWEGGGEYNVARGLRRCFGLRTGIVTALVDNPVGRLAEGLMLQGGVDVSMIRWVPDDGVGRRARNGLNFTERGFGVRAALGCSDRGYTAVSQLSAGDIDWERLFAGGVRWFHTGGIFAALSETTPEVAREAMETARRHGVIVSYDLNYRPSLWRGIGGAEKARVVNRELVSLANVLFGNEEDFSVAFGFPVEGVDEHHATLPAESFRRMIDSVRAEFPSLEVIATTLRAAHTATRNDWGAVAWCDGQFYEATPRPDLEILDRVGGGDSFASGLIYGFLMNKGAAWAVECGAAHGALAMTTSGDTSMASLAEVERVMKGGTARVSR
jgi:2-dehydro-3-deoxygluconokinase